MDIFRNAELRYRGTDCLVTGKILHFDPTHLPGNNVRWDSYGKQLVISLRYNTGPDGVTQHHYTPRLSLQDMGALIECLAHATTINSVDLVQPLAEHRDALFALHACASGYALAKIARDRTDAAQDIRGQGYKGSERNGTQKKLGPRKLRQNVLTRF